MSVACIFTPYEERLWVMACLLSSIGAPDRHSTKHASHHDEMEKEGAAIVWKRYAPSYPSAHPCWLKGRGTLPVLFLSVSFSSSVCPVQKEIQEFIFHLHFLTCNYIISFKSHYSSFHLLAKTLSLRSTYFLRDTPNK